MKIKKYEGKNEQEIMQQIKEELGPNAIVLNIKTVKSKGILKFFIKDRIQITAAVDEIDSIQTQPTHNTENVLSQLQSKMDEMEKMLQSTVGQINQAYETPQSDFTSKSKMEHLIYQHLIDQEVEHEVVMALLNGIDDVVDDRNIKEVVRIVYNNICKMIGDVSIIKEKKENENTPEIIFFIGPTGVGKTTSIAKLTADFSLKRQKQVGLITADTYRIAAIDQLRTYAEILSIPLKVIYSPTELLNAVETFKEKDYIFIDTAGRSHKNNEQLLELEEILATFPYKKVYLVLSATTKFKDLKSIVKQYTAICDEYAIIITKTDETTSLGTILNLRYYIDKPLSYMTFGQGVPDDIEVINSGKYAKTLLGSLENE